MKYFLTIVITLAVLAGAALYYAWSGMYNIAATEPHWAVTLSFIRTLRDRSIEVRSEDIQAPNLNDPKLKQIAFPHYHDMCRLCHGAPGYTSEDFAWGLYPVPPKMTSGHIQKALSEAEIYWIVQHGIKMTGMPAFGNTHTEKEMWGLVALAEEMPRMGAEQYGEMVKAMNPEEKMGQGHARGESESENGHGHGPGEPSGQGEAREKHL